MQNGSEALKLGKLINEFGGKEVIIPLLQRNYKWDIDVDRKGGTSAKKLLEDILKAKDTGKTEYAIGMATFYMESDQRIQVIDGQQRMITLSLLAKALGHDKEFVPVSFERDERKERENYLRSDVRSENVDVRHMEAVYICFRDRLREKEKEDLYHWILEHVKIICRYTENEPLQEFLNLNERKTRFSSTDYDRAYQLRHQSGKQKITPAMIIKEHARIESYLYTNEDIYSLVSKNYKSVPNRMDRIFEKRLGNNQKYQSLSDYYEEIEYLNEDEREKEYEKCYEYLKRCHRVLRSISQELKEVNESRLNVNTYNAVMALYALDEKLKFFDLIDDNGDSMTLEERIYSESKSRNLNAFMQSQLRKDLLRDRPGDWLEWECGRNAEAYSGPEQAASGEIEKLFDEKVRETVLILEKGKNYPETSQESAIKKIELRKGEICPELVKGGRKSLLDILSKTEQIIVPAIQRDYTFGSDEKKVEELLFDISKAYISDWVRRMETQEFEETERLSRFIVLYFLKRGSLWDNFNRYRRANKAEYEKHSILFKQIVGKSMEDYGIDWTSGRKARLDEIMGVWSDAIKKFEAEEKFELKEVKNGAFFRTDHENKEEFFFSVIVGYLEDGNLYLYDGQQRITTLVFLCAYMIYKEKGRDADRYRELLCKFKFTGREEANKLLGRLLSVENEKETLTLKEIKDKYVADHSSYSIYTLLKTYDDYDNGYDKKIMSFDLDYLMHKVIFELAAVKEASAADQLYMDLNSKNIPLTLYENYKAELVYRLSSRFADLFKQDWKYQLDNQFLNLCYAGNAGWKKARADEAERLEISIIHWCFKMSCMERGVLTGKIYDVKERLRWMEEEDAKEIVRLAGNILNTKIFNTKEALWNFIKEVSRFSDDGFSWEEFIIWHGLRRGNSSVPSRIDKPELVINEKKVKVYNISFDESRQRAEYILWLSVIKSEKKAVDPSMIQFLLQKYHSYWEKGYLEAYEAEASSELDYYSEEYLKTKPEDMEWIDYIFTIKLNEMLDERRYEFVKEWEKAEYAKAELFHEEERRTGGEKFQGNYFLWKYAVEKLKNGGCELTVRLSSGADVSSSVLKEVPDEWLKLSRLQKMIWGEESRISITINCQDNQDIYGKIKEHIWADPDKRLRKRLLEKIQETYYIGNHPGHLEIFGCDPGRKSWRQISSIEIGRINIAVKEMPDEFKKQLIEEGSNLENMIRYFWSIRDHMDFDTWLRNWFVCKEDYYNSKFLWRKEPFRFRTKYEKDVHELAVKLAVDGCTSDKNVFKARYQKEIYQLALKVLPHDQEAFKARYERAMGYRPDA